jgi:spermidine synthase
MPATYTAEVGAGIVHSFAATETSIMHTSDFEVLEATDTPIGMIYLSRRSFLGKPQDHIFEIHIDGALLMSSLNPVSERALSHLALRLHHGREGLRVLIGGLGLGYTAQAALQDSRVESVRIVDKMAFVIDWMKKGLLPLSDLLSTPKVQLVQDDVYANLLGPADDTYDLILIDVDHEPDRPLDPSSAPFYTIEGQRQVAKHLAAGGVLGVWSASDHEGFFETLGEVYPQTSREYISWTNDYEGETSQSFNNVVFLAKGTQTLDI